MSLSVAPLVVSLIVTNRIRKYVKTNILQRWEKPLKYALFLSVLLFAAEVIFSDTEVTKWVWHAYLVTIIVFALKQEELRLLRMFIVAFIPFELFSLLGDLTQLINDSFFKDHANYFNNATGFYFFLSHPANIYFVRTIRQISKIFSLGTLFVCGNSIFGTY